ncbi:conserved membrane hypothetical protein [uncultured Sporomusa sp.]|uniref:DUF2179 domain-containing protein n=1 Tax=uncultured Sporomusa sp. TaxID=307249 RepID=A0A212LU79_9FIRM|nr:YitT family protein [uncultured Sporomusa sp.]SCM81155.1 conserved membrane hypothetical protein [uncultured Sporomusa sp.]
MRDTINQYVWVAIGCLVAGFSINAFLVPHHLLSGGISGVAIIFYFLFGLPIGIQILVMNIPLLYAAYRILGKEYTIGTVYGTIIFSLTVDATKFVSQLTLIDDPIISAITGGVVSGIGSGLIFRVNGSAGGLDIVAAIIKKFYSLNFGIVGFAINCVIMVAAAALFGLKLAMLTLISMFIAATLTDKVVEGFNRRKTVFIVSYNTDKIVDSIFKEVGRGVTILNGQGAYTRQDKQVLFVVVTLTQIAKLKQLVTEADPRAFMIVHDAAEVMGRGFTMPGVRQL